jgi:hypothetical protein
MDKAVDHIANLPFNDVRPFRSTDRRPRDFEGAARLGMRIAFRKSQSLKTNRATRRRRFPDHGAREVENLLRVGKRPKQFGVTV